MLIIPKKIKLFPSSHRCTCKFLIRFVMGKVTSPHDIIETTFFCRKLLLAFAWALKVIVRALLSGCKGIMNGCFFMMLGGFLVGCLLTQMKTIDPQISDTMVAKCGLVQSFNVSLQDFFSPHILWLALPKNSNLMA